MLIGTAFSEKVLLNLLFNLSRFTDSVTKIIELRATNLCLAEYYDLINVGRMKGEGLLNTYAVRNTSYSEGLRDSAAVLSDNGTLEHLNSFLLTLDDLDVNLYAVADTECGNFGLKLLVNKSLDLFHFMASFKLRTFVQSIVEDRPDNITGMQIRIRTVIGIITYMT